MSGGNTYHQRLGESIQKRTPSEPEGINSGPRTVRAFSIFVKTTIVLELLFVNSAADDGG